VLAEGVLRTMEVIQVSYSPMVERVVVSYLVVGPAEVIVVMVVMVGAI
jgi:hypothetical protein